VSPCLEIEKEVDEGTLESGSLAREEDIAASADLGGPFQIKEAETRADRHVILSAARGGIAPVADGDVCLGVKSHRKSQCGEIGYAKEEVPLLGIEFGRSPT
jgi:hypothetical protein